MCVMHVCVCVCVMGVCVCVCVCVRACLTWISSQIHGVVGLSRGGLWVGVLGAGGFSIHNEQQAVLTLLGHQVVPEAVTHPRDRLHRHTACPVVHMEHHLNAPQQVGYITLD